MPTRNNIGHLKGTDIKGTDIKGTDIKDTDKNAATFQGTSGNAKVCTVKIAQTFQSRSLQSAPKLRFGRRKTPLFLSGLLLLFMAFLVGCPAPFGYFPNPEDRLPPNVIDNNLITTAEPFWYWRELGGTGDWAVIASPTFTSPVNVELIARSITPGAKLFYVTGRKTAPPQAPHYPNLKSGVIDESKPLQHSGSSYGETYTAIAIASLHYPSIFKWVDVTLDALKAGTPTFNIEPRYNYDAPQSLELLTPSKVPRSEEPLPLYYTFTTDGSEPPNPTDSSTAYTAPINILMFPDDIYRIKVISIHPDYNTSGIVDAIFSRQGDEDSDGIIDDLDVDDDNDGLIEIDDINMLEDMINDPDGYSYNGATTGGSTASTAYCSDDANTDGVYLCGYELRRDLDFTQGSSYASGTVDAGFCPDVANNCIGAVGQTGFSGIGISGGTAFSGIFEGNGRTISNFYRRADGAVGLFNNVEGGSLRNIGVVNAHVFGGTSGGDRVGALVGQLTSAGEVLNSYSTGSVDGVSDDTPTEDPKDRIGGLIGETNAALVRNSHSRAAVDTGSGGQVRAGGLIGCMNGSTQVIASFATGDITTTGGSSWANMMGGLVGFMANVDNLIIASFATGKLSAGLARNAVTITMGGLVGGIGDSARVIASYASGSVTGRLGATDNMGGLIGNIFAVGYSRARPLASYTTIDIDAESGDRVGLVTALTGTLGSVATYGFGTHTGEGIVEDDGIAHPSGVSAATGLTLANAGAVWNQATSNTAGAWDFGTSSQNPALVYADYDGDGTAFSCADFPATLIGGAPLICGTTLVGGAAEHGR